MSVRSVSRLLAAVPPMPAVAAAAVAAPLLAVLSPGKGRAWRTNVRAAGLEPEIGRGATTIAPFRHHTLLLYESLAMLGGRRFPVGWEGEEHLHGALRGGRGLLVVTAHLGNWHVGARELHDRTGKPVHSVAGTQFLRRWTDELRTMYRQIGLELHPRDGSTRCLLRVLRQGGIVALQLDGDQHARSGPATRGASLLSRRAGCPTLPAVCERIGPGRFVIRFAPPLEGGDRAPDSGTLSRTLLEMVRGRCRQWALFRPLTEAR